MTERATRRAIYSLHIEDARDLCHLLHPTEQHVHISRQQVCQRYTVEGVPARRVDVLVEEGILDLIMDPVAMRLGPDGHAGQAWLAHRGVGREQLLVVELLDKAGRYDGAVRPRLALRTVRSHVARDLRLDDAPLGRLYVRSIDGRLTIDLAGERIASEHQLRDALHGYDLPRIAMWHWTRYYQACLTHEEAVLVAAEFASAVDRAGGLAEANRLASRMLYRAARNAGWRKLTLRERAKLGLDVQWVPDAVYVEAREAAGLASPTGCGEFTLESAGGPECVSVMRIAAP